MKFDFHLIGEFNHFTNLLFGRKVFTNAYGISETNQNSKYGMEIFENTSINTSIRVMPNTTRKNTSLFFISFILNLLDT